MVARRIGLVVCLAGALGGEEGLEAAADCERITRLPFVISQPGRYCAIGRLTLRREAGAAIQIDADGVDLSLAGAHLESLADHVPRADGVRARGRRNIAIRGGTIRGFRYGVLIADSAANSEGHWISDVTVTDSAVAGIAVSGARSVVRRCRVSNTGGPHPLAVGLSYRGADGALLHNTVSRTWSSAQGGRAAGIIVTPGPRLTVRGNVVRGVRAEEAVGVRCGAPYGADNRVDGAAVPCDACELALADAGPHAFREAQIDAWLIAPIAGGLGAAAWARRRA